MGAGEGKAPVRDVQLRSNDSGTLVSGCYGKDCMKSDWCRNCGKCPEHCHCDL